MNVYLLPKSRSEYLLYCDKFQTPEKPLRTQLDSEPHRFLQFMKSTYESLTAKGRRYEAILKEIRNLDRINVIYPANLPEDRARKIWEEIIQSKITKHRRWLIVDSALLPLGVLFTFVPGPNLVLAYLGWRAIGHYKSKRGGEKAISRLEVDFTPNAKLAELERVVAKQFSLNRKEKIRQIGERIGIRQLDALY